MHNLLGIIAQLRDRIAKLEKELREKNAEIERLKE
jgi:predicted RNase H-like nuclease (RuvC/YqgF family)